MRAATPHKDPRCRGDTPKEHGTVVDSEIELFTKLGHREFHRVRPDPDPCTRRLIQFLADFHWVPVAAQYPVFSDKLRIATALDLLCRDENNKLILVELKCSKHSTPEPYQLAHGYMAAPLRKVPRSYKNNHLLQLLLSQQLLVKSTGIKPDAAYVVRVGADDVWVYALEEAKWCKRLASAAWRALDPTKR
jgi:hypothetical protein